MRCFPVEAMTADALPILHTSDSSDVVVDTGRLFLRPWRESDAGALYRYASDGRVSEMALWPRHTSVEMSRQVINEFFIPNPCNFAMVLKATGEPVGCIGLVPEGDEHCPPAAGEREVGYWIGYPYWGRGLTTEALQGLIGWCGRTAGIDSLLLTTDIRNVASQRVAEKCGFIHMADTDFEGIPTRVFRLALVAARLEIRRAEEDPCRYLDLLLMADESEPMIMKYLHGGNLYVGSVDGSDVAVAVATERPDGSVEINNLAVAPDYRRKGIGRQMLRHIESLHQCRPIYIGTGETPSTLRFYESCGYRYSHRVPGFFTDNYPAPIVEEGVTLTDMIYLCKRPDPSAR